MNNERMIAVSSGLIERAVSLLDLLPESGTIIELRAALATQPAAGEQVAVIDINTVADYVADNWPMKKYHLEEIESGLRSIVLNPVSPAAAHGDELVAVVGTVPDGSGFKSLDFKVALESLPDGTRLFAMRAQAGEGGEV